MRQFLSRSMGVLVFGMVACVSEPPTSSELSPDVSPHRRKIPLTADWSVAMSIELARPGASANFNTAALDGCPMPSRDGRLFFMASTRPGGVGGRDIWVSARASESKPWGEPTLVGEPISTVHNDFCPMLAGDGETFYFVSDRPGGCGGTDIYVARRNRNGSFTAPKNLGCSVNSAGNEEGPVPGFEPRRGRVLYFSSARPGGFAAEAPEVAPDFDLYVTSWRAGAFQVPTLVPGVNSDVHDGQPFLSGDSRELFFYSTRPGGLGGPDIWVASRERAWDGWGAPTNLGPNVNSAAPETRPSLSSDGTRLYFGTTRDAPVGEGSSDIFVATRGRVRHDR
jgi:Tol biopolymer transport system component